MKELTKAESQVMQILWSIEKGFVKDIIEKMPKPKPAYNTVSTIVRILEKKGFVDHQAYGNTYQYFPSVLKDDYTREFMSTVVRNYFSNSFRNVVSYFASGNKLSLKELEDIRKIMDEEIKRKKK